MSCHRIRYVLSATQPHLHYFAIEATLVAPPAVVVYTIPSWTPGSYLMREYSQHIEQPQAHDHQGNPLPITKTNKNTFKLKTPPQAQSITISYQVYAFDLTVRTCYLDSHQGYITPAAVFGFFENLQQLPATLLVNMPAEWQTISTALPQSTQPNTYMANTYGTLVDSPLLLGNHQTATFEAAGIPHTLAWFGHLLCDLDKLLADMATIINTQWQAMNQQHPCKHYLFILHIVPGGRGGLEHLHSTCLMADPQKLTTQQGYIDFLGLVSHEYFHLWNGKRVRPYELGPFDYTTENYTTLLWQVEGFTSYFDDLFLCRAKLIKPALYLNKLEANFNYTLNHPATQQQTLTQSSFDAWVKFYRSNENTPNAVVSYYTKGAALTCLIDVLILHHTQGQKRLDDVVVHLYQQYHLQQGRGFTETDLLHSLLAVSGYNFEAFYQNYINGQQLPNHNEILNLAGLQLKAKPNADALASLGLSCNPQLELTYTHRHGAATQAGLQPGDELLALDGFRVANQQQLSQWAAALKNKTIEVLYCRQGRIAQTQLTPQTPNPSYHLVHLPNPTKAQKQLYQTWLQQPWPQTH